MRGAVHARAGWRLSPWGGVAGGWRQCAAAPLACVTLVLGGGARAAAFLPGAAEPDPPTGEVRTVAPLAAGDAEAAVGKPAGSGIRWSLGPIFYRGSLGLDWRRLSTSDGQVSSGTQLQTDLQARTYIWQPWFIQLSGGLGLSLGRAASLNDGEVASRNGSLGVTGRLQMTAFPSSRFPFEARLSASDTRSTGETLVSNFRVWRFGLNQQYRPLSGDDSYVVNLDYSRAEASDGVRDTLLSLEASSQHRWIDHSLDTVAAFNTNRRSDSEGSSRAGTVSARHGFQPDSAFSADTLAMWTSTRLDVPGFQNRTTFGTDLLQVASTFSWRAREDDWLYSATAPVTLGGSLRVAESAQDFGGGSARSRLLNASAGIAQNLSQTLRGSLSAGYGWQGNGDASSQQSNVNGSLSYSQSGMALGDWRYTPSASVNTSLSSSSRDSSRRVLSVQGGHSLSRAWSFETSDSVSFAVAQSFGAAREWPTQLGTQGLVHTVSGFWQSFAANGSQSYVSVSASDSRSRDGEGLRGTFQMVNLQISRREQLSRFNSWSAGLTAQMSRSDTDQIDPITLELRQGDNGWQRFYNGSLTYTSQRFFGVPQLRFSAELSVNSQLFERRRLGDVNAPLEQSTESAEARLEYTIGRLESRLSARMARIDGQRITQLAARLQRRF